MFVATIGVSVPSFLLGMCLIIIFGVQLRILPFVGLRTPANYVLPVIALSLYPISMIARLTRSSMLEVMKQDYIIPVSYTHLHQHAADHDLGGDDPADAGADVHRQPDADGTCDACGQRR